MGTQPDVYVTNYDPYAVPPRWLSPARGDGVALADRCSTSGGGVVPVPDAPSRGVEVDRAVLAERNPLDRRNPARRRDDGSAAER